MTGLKKLYSSYLRGKSLIKQSFNSAPPPKITRITQLQSSYDANDGYCLDQRSVIQIVDVEGNTSEPSWVYAVHCIDKRIGLGLDSNRSAHIQQLLSIKMDTHLFIRYAAMAPCISNEGVECEIVFSSESNTVVIARLPLSGGMQTAVWHSVQMDISHLAGHSGYFQLRCISYAEDVPASDSLLIADFCIASEDQLSRIKSRTFYDLRSANEIAHFSSTYRHSSYAKMQDAQSKSAGGTERSIRRLMPLPESTYQKHKYIFEVLPTSSDSVFTYSARLLEKNLLVGKPDFVQLLVERARLGKPVKVLSLCAGAARIEAAYAAHLGANVEWSLIDINSDLLRLASSQFPPDIKLDLIEANINDVQYSGEKWDIIMCISALHHVIELEKVMKFCYLSLNADGEFWSLGESIGRNGNRLWPEARDRANAIFKNLPEKYRINSHSLQVDELLPDNDYSVGCFEGIRSEDIEPIIDVWFQQVDVFRANCFLWRLVNLAYNDNYNLNDECDINLVKSFVEAELDYYYQGGRGTELFGVYKPRQLLNKTQI